jgi:uncharacterized membrane protein YeaQ/YmgE (transglycosylase-associated protein family)
MDPRWATVYHLRAGHPPDYVPALARCSTPERLFWAAHRVGPSSRIASSQPLPYSESISLLGTNQSDTTRFTMAILSTILVGLVVGVIAKLLMPGKDPGGFIVTILLGIAGAFIATYLGQALGWYKAGQPAGWIMSIIGAMILLLLYRLLFKRKQ